MKWEKDEKYNEWSIWLPNKNQPFIFCKVLRLGNDARLCKWEIHFILNLKGLIISDEYFREFEGAKKDCERYLKKLAKMIMEAE